MIFFWKFVLLSGQIRPKLGPPKAHIGFQEIFQGLLSHRLGGKKAIDVAPKMNIWWQELVQGLLSHCLGGKRHRWDPKKLIYSGRNSFRDFCANVWAEKKAIDGAPKN